MNRLKKIATLILQTSIAAATALTFSTTCSAAPIQIARQNNATIEMSTDRTKRNYEVDVHVDDVDGLKGHVHVAVLVSQCGKGASRLLKAWQPVADSHDGPESFTSFQSNWFFKEGLYGVMLCFEGNENAPLNMHLALPKNINRAGGTAVFVVSAGSTNMTVDETFGDKATPEFMHMLVDEVSMEIPYGLPNSGGYPRYTRHSKLK
jgi:hypothetical protein